MQAVADEQLIRWVADGDVSCVGTLFERHHGGVFRYCLQITKDKELSEDLVQEVFMKVLSKAKTYRGDGSFKAWLFNMARNVAFDQLRLNQRRHAQHDPSVEAGPSSEELASSQESLDLAVRALDSLPETVREVIWLGRFEFDGYEDLGVALGCAPGTARVRMHRAMKQFAEVFSTMNGGPQSVQT